MTKKYDAALIALYDATPALRDYFQFVEAPRWEAMQKEIPALVEAIGMAFPLLEPDEKTTAQRLIDRINDAKKRRHGVVIQCTLAWGLRVFVQECLERKRDQSNLDNSA